MTPGEAIAEAKQRAEALIALTQRLVRIDSQTPPSDTAAIVSAIESELAGTPGVSLSRYVSEPPVENLVARLDGGLPGKRLVLSGHLDTYPIGDASAWTQDPLGGAIVDGRLYGRGSADMKGGCAALIGCLRIFAERMRPFPGEIVLALGGDEERMGELGAQWLIDHVPEVRGDGVIVADVGGPRCLRLGEKGMIWIELEAEGKQSHGAHTYAGVNAADRLIDALVELRGLETMEPSPPAEALAIIEAATAVEGADGPSARKAMRTVTVNLGEIAGGASPNLVPEEARAGLDIRVPLGLSVAEVEAEVAAVLARHSSVSWRATRRYEPSWTSAESPIAKACFAAVTAVGEGPAWPDMRIGGSDARLWRRAGFETVVLGLTPNRLGAPDECFETDELWRLTAAHVLTAGWFLGAG